MKNSLTLFSLLILLLSGSAISQTLPKSGAVIRTSATEVALAAGETTEIELTLIRSKIDRKTKFDAPVIQPISGLEAQVRPTETPDVFVLALTPASLEAGNHLLIVQGAGANKRYVTSTMINLVVGSKETLALQHD